MANGFATSVNWTANLVIGATFLHLVRWLTTAGAFAIYAVITLSAWFFIYTTLPETSGLSLEETRHIFQKQADERQASFPIGDDTDGHSEHEQLLHSVDLTSREAG